MGIFNQEEDSKKDFYAEVKPRLKEKDGNIHLILIRTNCSITNEAVKQYTIKMDDIFNGMQKDGYEIIDTKLEIMENSARYYETLIIYK